MNERLLIEKIKQGDKKAFRKVFLNYYDDLVIFSWKYVKSKAVAEETVQEVFLQLWENYPEWNPTSIKPYLYASVRNKSLDHIRHEKVRNKHSERMSSENKSYYETNMGEENNIEFLENNLQKAIDELPPRCKEIFRLSRDEGLTYKEISEVLDISESTVENQISRAMKILREASARFIPFR